MTPKDIHSKINEILKQNEFRHIDTKKLIETNPNAKCKEVEIKFKGNLSIYKFDTLNVFPFFSQGEQNMLCDYFIFHTKENKLYIFLCNLKSEKLTKNTHQQIYAGQIFGKFIVENACRVLEGQSFPESIVHFRAIHFNLKTPKLSVNPRNIKFSKYPNGLEYMFLSCKNIADFEILTKIK
jgi:hypothetical protein